jgi:hypothetical protein
MESRFIELDEIVDPYERMKGDYYIVEITKTEYCDHREQNQGKKVVYEYQPRL